MLNLCGLVVTASLAVGQTPEVESPVYSKLAHLECFVGDWEARATIPQGATPSEVLGDIAGKEVVLTSSVKWAPGKCAQIVTVDYHMMGVQQILGTSIRAWDQETDKICERQFTTHKGTWTGIWTKEGDTWVYNYNGMNLDGKKCSGRRLITFQGDDLYVSKDIDQFSNGEPEPDIEWRFHRKRKSAGEVK